MEKETVKLFKVFGILASRTRRSEYMGLEGEECSIGDENADECEDEDEEEDEVEEAKDERRGCAKKSGLGSTISRRSRKGKRRKISPRAFSPVTSARLIFNSFIT